MKKKIMTFILLCLIFVTKVDKIIKYNIQITADRSIHNIHVLNIFFSSIIGFINNKINLLLTMLMIFLIDQLVFQFYL